MSIKKIRTSDAKIKWEVYLLTNGKGSTRVRRRFDTRNAAEEFLLEYKTQQRAQKQSGPLTGTFEGTVFGDEAKRWLEHGASHFRPSHLRRVTRILEEILPKLGSLTPDKFTPEFIAHLQRGFKSEKFLLSEKSRPQWVTERRRLVAAGLLPAPKRPSRYIALENEIPRSPSNATVNRKIEVITAILNYSAKQRRIPFSPCSKISPLPDETGEMRFWERNEAESFLSFANFKHPTGSKDRWKYVVYLTALNGVLRAGEIWGLQSRDISVRNTLFIRRQFERIQKKFAPLKSRGGRDSFRHVPCNEQLRRELLALVTLKSIQPDETIFHSATRRPIDHDVFVRRVFSKDLREWGGRKIRFHDLRHTGTTLLIAAGIDLKTVMEICGHQNIQTTMRYAHMIGGKISDVANSFAICPPGESSGVGLRLVQE
jgi:integrase